MNQQNMSKLTSSSTSDHPVKRKRGRPRKDEHMSRNENRQIPSTSSSLLMSQASPIPSMTNIQQPLTIAMNNPNISTNNHNMVGKVVTGVIDGVFDGGYLLSVRVGPSNTLLRGLVFQQGHFCPITQANDVVPHLNMSRREYIQMPITNKTALYTSQGACVKQTPQIAIPATMNNYQAAPMMAGGRSNSAVQPDDLRIVEQDELMQVFEISKMVEENPKNDECDHGLKNDHQLVSDSYLVAESLPKNETSPHCGTPNLVQDNEHQALINEVDTQKQQEDKYVEPINHIETCMEEPQSVEKEIVQQESLYRRGEVNKIDVNQDPNQGVATDDFQAY